MELRLGFIGVVVEEKESVSEVNRILSQNGEIIRGRIGVPGRDGNASVIGLVVEGTNDQIGGLTGKLGNLKGIQVKSAMTGKNKIHKE